MKHIGNILRGLALMFAGVLALALYAGLSVLLYYDVFTWRHTTTSNHGVVSVDHFTNYLAAMFAPTGVILVLAIAYAIGDAVREHGWPWQ